VHDEDQVDTDICLVPEYNPLVLAKTVATVDRLSNGRFILGVGVGWLAEQFEALGVPFERRGQRTREYIEVMRKLWTERSSSHQGEFVKFTNVLSFPKPVSDKGVPVWFGGENNPALRRVAEYGDGWIGFNLLPEEAAGKIKRIEELLKANGRNRSDVNLAVSPDTKPIKTDDLKLSGCRRRGNRFVGVGQSWDGTGYHCRARADGEGVRRARGEAITGIPMPPRLVLRMDSAKIGPMSTCRRQNPN
jgi:probable F420-dependent oxidoreductase